MTPEFQPDLFQPMELPRSMLPATLQPETVSLLSKLLAKIIESASIVPVKETTDE